MGHPDAGAVAELARIWLRGVTSAGFVPGPRARTRYMLEDLVRQIVAAVTAEPFDPAAGDRFGAQLVHWRMTAPEVLGTTMALLGEHLPALIGDYGEHIDARMRQLLARLATGFAGAQRRAALAAAEQINVAYRTIWHARLTELEEQLRHSLLYDQRTGLRNRAGLRKYLGVTAEYPHTGRIGLCVLSIDRFAEINDALGHEHGGRLLQAVAARLRALAAKRRYLVAHPVDDQFALVLAGTTGVEEVVKAADEAGQLLQAPIEVDGLDLRLRVTAGVVEGAVADTQPDGWLRDAHLALHSARQDRRELAVFDPGRAAQDLHRQRLAAAMPAALDRGEFGLHFQPLYRLEDRRIVGVEALARWQPPDAALLGPHHFIGLAEQTGLIHLLGRSLLEQACVRGAAWRTRHPGLLISVNLSPLQLDDSALVADVETILRSSRLPAGSLQLEITESAAVVDDHHDTLHRLADLGIRLAIDDFGTGYSTFASLPDLPISAVKLAAELLPREPGDRARREILRSLIRLCHQLGISVTSEGIEKPENELLLKELGCDHGQGFHFARPADGDTITRTLAALGDH
jgi:diguanylate cyclase (GGDEF)-like protein